MNDVLKKAELKPCPFCGGAVVIGSMEGDAG